MLRFAKAGCFSATVLLGCTVTAASAYADGAEEFYRGKQIRLIVGNAVGADYDLGARLLARHMSRHMSGSPTILVQNMPGATSIGAANYIARVGKDGMLFGSVSRNLPSQAVIGRRP